MSKLQVDDIVNKGDNGAPGFSKGAVVTGVATATTFSGNLTGNVTGNVTGNADTATTATTATNAQGITGTPDITVRNVTGVGATFSGDVNISGTLSYEDVTNIDSVGIITAQAGVRVLGAGVTVAGIATFHNGADFNAVLIENVNIVANKLSAVPNINLDNGMVHYYTTNETTTANPNVFSTVGINTELATGETVSVTVMSKPNNAGYFPRFSIDDKLTGITTYWNGGSAPSSANSSGVDANSYQIIKTGDGTFDVLANASNFA
jgi:hypothetical protein